MTLISDYLPPFSPFSNIAPFTYKDGATYLNTLDDLRVYVNDTLVAFLNNNNTAIGAEISTLIGQVNTALDANLLAVVNDLSAQNTLVNGEITNLTNYVNAQVAAIVASSITVSDPVVNAIVNNAATATRIFLDGLYANKAKIASGRTFWNIVYESTSTVAAIVALADHTTFIQAAVDAAYAAGYRTVVIPQLDRTNAATPWKLTNQINLYTGMTLDARDALIVQKTVGLPGFYVGGTATNVKVFLGDSPTAKLYYDNGLGRRILFADIPLTGNPNGHTPRSNCTGVLIDGAYCTVTGTITGFVFGCQLLGGVTDGLLRLGNKVDITVSSVDFGIAHYLQSGGDFKVRGSYIQMTDSADPAHLLYAVAGPIPATNNSHEVSAWDSVGGHAVAFKGQSGSFIKSIVARNCPGILIVVDPWGPMLVDSIIGTDITTQQYGSGTASIIDDQGLTTSPPGYYSKMVGSARIQLATSVSTTGMRALNMGDDWNIGELDITYNTNVTDNAQTMVVITGNNAHIGITKIRNNGTGGIRGIRFYAGTSGHKMPVPPSITGGSDSVTVDSGVLSSDLCVNEEILKPTGAYIKLVSSVDVSTVIRNGNGMARKLRANRWFTAPVGSPTAISPTINNLCVVPITIQKAINVAQLSLTVTTAVAASTIRMGIYADNGIGYPGALIIDAGSIDTSTTGNKTIACVTTLPPGTYWIAYVSQGTTGVAINGLPLTAIDFPAATSALAITGLMPTHAAVSGVLPTAWAFVSDSTPAGVAKVAFQVV